MFRNGKTRLSIAGITSSLIAAMHIFILPVGEPAYRYFAGLGDDLANRMINGSLIPTILVAGIACFFILFAVYGFSGAKIIPPLPLLRPGLFLISLLYNLRGLSNFPFYINILFNGAQIKTYNGILYDAVSFSIGLFYSIGTYLEWNKLIYHGKAWLCR